MSSSGDASAPMAPPQSRASLAFQSLTGRLLGPVNQRIRTLVYALSPHRAARWVGLAVLVVLYALWVWVRPGWYIVTYGLGIYVLNLTVSFVSPVEDLGAADGRPLLPVTSDDSEAKPMMTKLPELKFWERATRGVLLAFLLTLVPAFNVPVFWPILLLYFAVLAAFTCRRQIGHMVRWGYVPFVGGKKRYQGAVGGFTEGGGGGAGLSATGAPPAGKGKGKWRDD